MSANVTCCSGCKVLTLRLECQLSESKTSQHLPNPGWHSKHTGSGCKLDMMCGNIDNAPGATRTKKSAAQFAVLGERTNPSFSGHSPAGDPLPLHGQSLPHKPLWFECMSCGNPCVLQIHCESWHHRDQACASNTDCHEWTQPLHLKSQGEIDGHSRGVHLISQVDTVIWPAITGLKCAKQRIICGRLQTEPEWKVGAE